MERIEDEWKNPEHVKAFLKGIREAVPFGNEQIEVMMRVIEAAARPVRRFLDLGCGDGLLTEALLAEFPDARGTLIDFSSPMLDEARTRLAPKAASLEFIEADFAAPAWVNTVKGPFDAVVSGYAIHHQPVERKKAIYAEIFGLLCPGGAFINIDHVSSPSERVRAMSDKLFVDSLYAFHKRKNPSKTYEEIKKRYTERVAREAPFLSSVEDQCRWLRETGFIDVDTYFKVFELAVFGGIRPAQAAFISAEG